MHGGRNHHDLTKAVTHLIAASPSGEKYEYARLWGVRVVSIEWLSDALQRGMALEESLYDPNLPPEERGKGALSTEYAAVMRLGKRTRDGVDVADSADFGRRKLRRTMSAKLGSKNEGLWNEITSGVGGGGTVWGNPWQDEEAIQVNDNGVIHQRDGPQIQQSLRVMWDKVGPEKSPRNRPVHQK